MKLDYDSKLDIDKWVNQARMYVEPLEKHRRSEMLLMLVDQTERISLESHCLVDRPLNTDEHVEYLLNVIKSMYKKKADTPTQNMEKFMRRKQRITPKKKSVFGVGFGILPTPTPNTEKTEKISVSHRNRTENTEKFSVFFINLIIFL